MCNDSAFAFGCYAAWLVSDPVNDVESGYYMVSFLLWQRVETSKLLILTFGALRARSP